MKCLKLASATTALVLTTSVNAATINGVTSILNQAEADQLESWLDTGSLGLTNIYTWSAGDDASLFHSAADNMGSTFTVMNVTTETGATFDVGGYRGDSWDSSGYYDYDATAFIFNLTDTVKASGQRHPQYATYDNATYGPTWGGGHDLFAFSGWASYGQQGYSYTDTNSCGGYSYSRDDGACTNIFGDTTRTNFVVNELEVFTVATVPLPATVWLFGSGLIGLAGMARRKRHA